MRAMRSIGGSSSRSPSADSDAAAAALRKRLHFARVGSFSFTIPAEVPRHEIESSLFVHRPMRLIAIHPHMHLLGREMKVWAKLPDESTRPLVHIDDWDFNWQGFYFYRSPVPLPRARGSSSWRRGTTPRAMRGTPIGRPSPCAGASGRWTRWATPPSCTPSMTRRSTTARADAVRPSTRSSRCRGSRARCRACRTVA